MQPIYLLLLATICLFNACSPIFYQPNTLNIPLISEEDEHRFSINYLVSEANGFEMQYAGTIGPSMAMMLNGMYVSKPAGSEFSGYGRLLEGGLGFYHPMGKFWSFNLFGGGGLGRAELKGRNFNQANFDFQRYFAQPTVGIRKENFEAGLALRVSSLIIYLQNNNLSQPDARAALTEFSRKAILLVEPGLVVRYGFKNVKLQLALNDVRWLNKIEFANNFKQYFQTSASISLILRFGHATF